MKTRILLELETDGLPNIDAHCTVIGQRTYNYLINRGITITYCQATLMLTETIKDGTSVRSDVPPQPVEDAV